MKDKIGSVYKILSNFGYTFDKYDNNKDCYIKGDVSIYVIPLYTIDHNHSDDDDHTYECSAYINGKFYENTRTNDELSNLLKIIERNKKIDKITK